MKHWKRVKKLYCCCCTKKDEDVEKGEGEVRVEELQTLFQRIDVLKFEFDNDDEELIKPTFYTKKHTIENEKYRFLKPVRSVSFYDNEEDDEDDSYSIVLDILDDVFNKLPQDEIILHAISLLSTSPPKSILKTNSSVTAQKSISFYDYTFHESNSIVEDILWDLIQELPLNKKN
uniref:Uncharacterized protein n=1 Tax=Clastoptera arizonana TaxID=38151 RepID=A0A1B6CUM3_9HEMI